MCDQIEQNFFVDGNTYLFGDKITAIDYIFYQELLTTMILTGQGNESNFFKEDNKTQLRLQNTVSWYKTVSKDE